MSGAGRHTAATAAALATLIAVLVQSCDASHGRGAAETPSRTSAVRLAAAVADGRRASSGVDKFELEKAAPVAVAVAEAEAAAAKRLPPIDVDGHRRARRTSDVSLVIQKIYDDISEANRRSRGSGGDRLDGFDVVRALEDNSGGGERLRYHFDTSSIDVSQETLTKAEFYVFIRAPRGSEAATTSLTPGMLKLSLYRVIDERHLYADNTTVDAPSPAAVSLLATRRVLASHRDEVDFRGSIALRDTLDEWITRPETNKGLLLTVTDGDRRRAGGPLENSADLFVVGGGGGPGREISSAGRQPVLIIYTKTRSQAVDAIGGAQPQARVLREVDRLAGDSYETPLCAGRTHEASARSTACAERDEGSGRDDGSERPGARRSSLPLFARRPPQRRNLPPITAGSYADYDVSSSAAARTPASSDEVATNDGSTASYGSGGGEDVPQPLPPPIVTSRRRRPPPPTPLSRQPRPPSAAADGFAADVAPAPPRSAGSCRPQPFAINFDELNYPVIAPKRLEVGRCAGSCDLPPGDLNRFNLTNHAKLLAMTRFLSLRRASLAGVCCVPGELIKASLLYSDEDGVVTMRNYDNMVVKSCTCR